MSKANKQSSSTLVTSTNLAGMTISVLFAFSRHLARAELSPSYSSEQEDQVGTKANASGASPSQANGTWTAEKKATFVDAVFAAGYKALDLEALAAQVSKSARSLEIACADDW